MNAVPILGVHRECTLSAKRFSFKSKARVHPKIGIAGICHKRRHFAALLQSKKFPTEDRLAKIK